MAASVRLRIDDGDGHSVGSGTIIDTREGEALVLTCGHVFRDSQGKGAITVDLFWPREIKGVPAQLIAYDLDLDLGLLSFRSPVPVTVAKVAPARYAVQQSDQVISIGCNHGADPTAIRSHVLSLNKFLGPANLQVAGQPVQGRSGGGLFSSEGLVIGVCNAADPADNQGLYAALPSVHRQLDSAFLSDIYRTAKPAAGGEMLAATKLLIRQHSCRLRATIAGSRYSQREVCRGSQLRRLDLMRFRTVHRGRINRPFSLPRQVPRDSPRRKERRSQKSKTAQTGQKSFA